MQYLFGEVTRSGVKLSGSCLREMLRLSYESETLKHELRLLVKFFVKHVDLNCTTVN